MIAAIIMRRWLASIRQALESARAGNANPPAEENIIPLGQEIRDVLQELEASRRTIDAAHTDWTPETLRAALCRTSCRAPRSSWSRTASPTSTTARRAARSPCRSRQAASSRRWSR